MAVTHEQLRDAMTRRWHRIDRLLPGVSSQRDTSLPDVQVSQDGELAAVGYTSRRREDPSSLRALWGPLDQVALRPRLADGDPGRAMDRLLSAWRDQLAALPEPPCDDSAAVIMWPSRDVTVNRVLYAHGFVPRVVLAARQPDTSRLVAELRALPRVRIRRAESADADVVAALWRQVYEFDVQAGACADRPGAAAAILAATRRLLARPRPWAWVAERAGEPLGVVMVEGPEETSWIAGYVAAGSVAYLGVVGVVEDARGGRLGSALAAQAHAAIDASGVTCTLLHHGAANPLSVPFWSRLGYRPLWTEWRAEPVSALR